jgi:hypothetical protein
MRTYAAHKVTGPAALLLTSPALRPGTQVAPLTAVLLEKHDMLVAIDRVVGEAEQQHCKGVQQV